MGKSNGLEMVAATEQRKSRTGYRSQQGSPTCTSPTKFSFDDELTFVPKLNSLSLKLAEANRTSLLDRKKQDKKSYDPVDLVFKPVVSEKSCKIVAKLKTDFWERQEKHVKNQREKLEHGPSTVHPNLRSPTKSRNDCYSRNSCYSPVKDKCTSPTTSVRQIDTSQKSSDDNDSDHSDNEVAKTSVDHTESQSSTRKIVKHTKKLRRKIKNKITISPKKVKKPHQKSNGGKNNKKPDKENTQKSFSVDTIPNNDSTTHNNNNNNNLLKTRHTRSSTFPQYSPRSRDDMDQNHQQLVKIKKIATHAIKNKKVFICNGPYHVLRAELRKRGWIEKHFKDVSSFKLNSVNEPDVVETDTKKQIRNLYSENSEFMQLEDYGIMSRIVRNSLPSFIWTVKRDDCDFRFLCKNQIVNHYASAWTFTTKAGLCINLRNVHYFENQTSHAFFPRCYRLCCDDEKAEFLEDFRLTAASSILKLVLENHEEWKKREETLKEDEEKEIENDDKVSSENGKTKKQDSETADKPLQNSETADKPSKNKSHKCYPSTILSLAMKACYHFLDEKEHLDIEETYQRAVRGLDEPRWTMLVNAFYKITHSGTYWALGGLRYEACLFLVDHITIVTFSRKKELHKTLTSNIRNGAIIEQAWLHKDECQMLIDRLCQHCPQMNIDGFRNIWILKPGAKSRGRGIELRHCLDDILNLTSDNVSKKENRWVIQKYIEQPFLIYRTKFDIRQWFLVTDWNPLVLWFYKDCYIRFCGQEFTFKSFGPQYHLSNNSVQKHYQIGERSEKLPDSNMWSSDEFRKFLNDRGYSDDTWSKIYTGMKRAITSVLQACQDSLEYRKNSFELYGADFMLSEDLNPWLIEINSSPALSASTDVTERLCANVIRDTLKVVLDRRENRNCDTGGFEIAFKQQHIPIPNYMGCSLAVQGSGIKKSNFTTKKQQIKLPPNIQKKLSDFNTKPVCHRACKKSKTQSKIVMKFSKSYTDVLFDDDKSINIDDTKGWSESKVLTDSKHSKEFNGNTLHSECDCDNCSTIERQISQSASIIQRIRSDELKTKIKKIAPSSQVNEILKDLTRENLLSKNPKFRLNSLSLNNKSSSTNNIDLDTGASKPKFLEGSLVISNKLTNTMCPSNENSKLALVHTSTASQINNEEKIPDKSSTRKIKREYGVLGSEEISGIDKRMNISPLYHYNPIKIQDIFVQSTFPKRLMKDAG